MPEFQAMIKRIIINKTKGSNFEDDLVQDVLTLQLCPYKYKTWREVVNKLSPL